MDYEFIFQAISLKGKSDVFKTTFFVNSTNGRALPKAKLLKGKGDVLVNQHLYSYSPFTIDNSQKENETFSISANNQPSTANVIPANCQLLTANPQTSLYLNF